DFSAWSSGRGARSLAPPMRQVTNRLAVFLSLQRVREHIRLVFPFAGSEAGEILFNEYRQLVLCKRLGAGYGNFLGYGPSPRDGLRDLYDNAIRRKLRAWLSRQRRGLERILETRPVREGNGGSDATVRTQGIDFRTGKAKPYRIVLYPKFQKLLLLRRLFGGVGR